MQWHPPSLPLANSYLLTHWTVPSSYTHHFQSWCFWQGTVTTIWRGSVVDSQAHWQGTDTEGKAIFTPKVSAFSLLEFAKTEPLLIMGQVQLRVGLSHTNPK